MYHDNTCGIIVTWRLNISKTVKAMATKAKNPADTECTYLLQRMNKVIRRNFQNFELREFLLLWFLQNHRKLRS